MSLNKLVFVFFLFVWSSLFVSAESQYPDFTVPTTKVIVKSVIGEDKTVDSTINRDKTFNNIKDISDRGPIKGSQDRTSTSNFRSRTPTFTNGKSESVLEEKTIQQETPSLTNNDYAGTDIVNNHTKSRKGAKSSVVPRKGVIQQGPNGINSSLISENSNSLNDIIVTSAVSDKTVVTTENQLNEKELQKMPKKPEVVSDVGDEFDKYSIIKTSTTGEDYVIIGIVIVIGIWFSVFGALMFYRRAGEYWDRRHYRRMDFLVEGMYND